MDERHDSVERVQLAREQPFRLGTLEVRPSTREIVGPDKRAVLQPRAMQVLVALARARGRVVDRDELMQSCWAGVVVGEESVTRVVSRLRAALQAMDAVDCRVEAIARVGYRLVSASEGGPKTPEPRAAAARGAPPPRSSVAVWPFENLSSDAADIHLAAGVVEEITTALSRYASLFVISSGSSRFSKLSGLSLEDAGRQLGVRYILNGSVRRANGSIRIAVKLTEAESGGHIWAQTFEGAVSEVFELQDHVALAVAGVLEPKVLVAEMGRASRPPTGSLNAFDRYLQALPLVQNFADGDQTRALQLLDESIRLDPNFGRALGAASFAHALLYEYGPAADAEHHRNQGLDLAARALRVGGEEPEVLAWVSDALVQLGQDLTTSIKLIERACAINPGSAYVWFVSATFYIQAGDVERGLEHLERAERLDPMSWIAANMLNWRAIALFDQGFYAEAVARLLEAQRLKPTYPTTLPLLTACYGQLGDLRAAAETMGAMRFSERKAALWAAHLFRRTEHRRRFLEGVARARSAAAGKTS